MRAKSFPAIFGLGVAGVLATTGVYAQTNVQRIALKSGESVELQPVYWVVNCRSTMVAIPELEILEGPTEETLGIKEEMVLPPRFNFANPVPRATIRATTNHLNHPAPTTPSY